MCFCRHFVEFVCVSLWLVCVVVTEINDSTGARCSRVLKHNFSPMMLKTSGTHKHKWMIANEGTVLRNKQIILIVLAWWDIAYCELPEAGDGGREVLGYLQCTFILTPDCRSCTYHRQKGVAEAESRLRREVLVRHEADPDLTPFGSVASWYRLWAAPATQDGFLSQILYFHIVVPGRQRKQTLIISLSETITRYWSTPLSWNCLCPRCTATVSNYTFVLVELNL